jgi:uncharacterized repeat protein (TIGR01451 family)
MKLFLRILAAAAVFAALTSPVTVAHAAVGDLYAVTGTGSSGFCTGAMLSTLYTLDPATGAATSVAPITVEGSQVRHVTGLAFHPSTGVLYGVMNSQEAGVDCGLSSLISIDPATGVATVIGDRTLFGPIPDIAFDPFGTLYGWSESNDDLIVIDITDGSFEVIESEINTFQTGLASDSNGNLFLKVAEILYFLNQYTAEEIYQVSVDRDADNVLAFDASDNLYSGERSSGGFTLFTIDRESGETTEKGSNAVTGITAITFNRGTVTPPDIADVTITKEVDDDLVVTGEEVVFTLTLDNHGPATAGNVIVSDVLPSNFTFVSATGDGTYNEVTGDWDVSNIADEASAVLEITATAAFAGEYTNVAQVIAANFYDPDSVPNSGDDDMQNQVSGTILEPMLFSIDRDDGYLWVVDPAFSDTEVAQEITLSGHDICGGNGLAAQPETGALFGVVTVDDCSNGAPRTLVSIDPVTAEATEIGSFGSTRIAALAFGADSTTLYAASGNGGSAVRKLFSVDTTTGALTQECSLGFSDYGRALAFVDGLLYDARRDCPDDNCQIVLQVIDPAQFPADPEDPCPGTEIETGLDREPTALAFDETGSGFISLYLGSFNELWFVVIPGQSQPADVSFLGYMAHSTKGLAVTAAAISKANVQVQKFAVKDRVKGDKFLTYQIYVSNSGPDTIGGIEVTDPLPFGTTFVSGDGNCEESGGVVSCLVTDLEAGTSQLRFFTVQVTCKKCSSISNTVQVSPNGGVYEYPFDNQAQISTSVKGKF